MKRTITPTEYLQVLGLLTLGDSALRRLEGIEESMREIFGVREADLSVSGIGDPQHICDALYSRYNIDDLLKKLNVSVVPEPQGAAGASANTTTLTGEESPQGRQQKGKK